MRGIVFVISLWLLVACSNDIEPTRGGDVSIAYLWSMATAQSVDIKDDYTVRGYVVANDKYDEIASSFVVADATAGIVVEVDSRDVNSLIPLFSEVAIRCSGLSMSRYGRRIVLGIKGDGDYMVSRIPETEIYNRITVDSTTYHDVEPLRRRAGEITENDMLRYVRVDNVRAIDCGALWTDMDTLTGRRLTTVRHFTDGEDTLSVVTDGQCYYADHPLPTGHVTLAGIIDWHDGAIALRITNRGIILQK